MIYSHMTEAVIITKMNTEDRVHETLAAFDTTKGGVKEAEMFFVKACRDVLDGRVLEEHVDSILNPDRIEEAIDDGFFEWQEIGVYIS